MGYSPQISTYSGFTQIFSTYFAGFPISGPETLRKTGEIVTNKWKIVRLSGKKSSTTALKYAQNCKKATFTTFGTNNGLFEKTKQISGYFGE